jgi:hypothetical protein
MASRLQKIGFKVAHLRRNFRNAKPIYELAHLIAECNFDVKKIVDVYSKTFLNKKNSIQDLEFDIHHANFPKCIYLDDEVSSSYDEPHYQNQLISTLSTEYKHIIMSECINEGKNPEDLLILVPDTIGEEITALRLALKSINLDTGIGYIDYVEKGSRKHIAPEGKIRIVTFHSSRGLEAANVVVIGIEKLLQLGRTTGIDPSRLGYIIISRAIFNLIICLRSSKKTMITNFIESAVSHINVNYG